MANNSNNPTEEEAKLLFSDYDFNKTISISFLSIFCLSCAFLIQPKQNLKIENKSSQKLSISFWEKSVSLLQFEVPSGGTFDSTVNYRSSFLSIYPVNSDSIVIKFGDDKGFIQYCEGQSIFESQQNKKCSFDYDFFYDQGFIKKERKTGTKFYKMTFTEDDYLKAKPI